MVRRPVRCPRWVPRHLLLLSRLLPPSEVLQVEKVCLSLMQVLLVGELINVEGPLSIVSSSLVNFRLERLFKVPCSWVV